MSKEKLVLPITNLTYPGMDYSQDALLAQLRLYEELKKRKDPEGSGDFPFDVEMGLCVGLTAYWLYSKRVGEEGKFIDKLEHALRWDAEKFAKLWAKEDPKLEAFINIIAFLSFDIFLRKNIHQDNLGQSIQLILSEFYPKIAEPEFKITFSFTQDTLTQLIDDVVFPNKMIRIGDGFHAVSLIYSGGVYYFYNPDSETGPRAFNTAAEVAAAIFDSLNKAKAYQSKEAADHLALNLTCSDLEGEEPGEYPDQAQYCANLLADEKNKTGVMADKNLCHLAARYNNYPILDLLFDSGYKYIPWEISDKPELNEAIAHENETRVKYLLAHGLPVDYRTEEGLSPLGVAIVQNNSATLFTLLAAGADPNFLAMKDTSTLELALDHAGLDVVILLLASGLEISEKNLSALFTKFSDDKKQIQFIIQHALQLNKKLLNLPDMLDLDHTSSKEIVAFLQHAKLSKQLGVHVGVLILVAGGEKYRGEDALKKISEYYHTSGKIDLFDFSQKTEIYKLLKFFKPETFEFKDSGEFIKLLAQIAQKITSKPLKDHSVDDLFEIEVIMDKLAELSSYKASIMHPIKMRLSYKASAVLDSIKSYMQKNGVKSIEEYLVKRNPDPNYKSRHLLFSAYRETTQIDLSYSRDVAPLLKA